METATPLLLAIAFVGFFSLLVTVGSQLCVHWTLACRSRRPERLPSVSILKPLKGTDDQLFENLASIAGQDYPVFEVLFGVEDAADPALEVARQVKEAFPSVPIRVIVCRKVAGMNPKVRNLMGLAEQARYDLLLVSDSNVEVDRDYLRSIAAELDDPAVGLVTNVIVGHGEATIGAALENLQLNTWVSSAVCASHLVRHPCVVGKSMLFRRQDLERVGGFRGVRDVLAEDYLLGQKFARAGYRVALSTHTIRTVNRERGIAKFAARHLRWSQMRRRVASLAYLLEPILDPLPWLFAALFMAVQQNGFTTSGHGGWNVLIVSGIGLKIVSDVALIRRLRGRFPRADVVALIPIKNLLILGIWAVALFHRTIVWRGNKMRITAGSVLEPLRGCSFEKAACSPVTADAPAAEGKFA